MGKRDRAYQAKRQAVSNAAAEQRREEVQLLSALAILVQRNGGSLEVPNVDEFKDTSFSFNLAFDKENNTLHISVDKVEEPNAEEKHTS